MYIINTYPFENMNVFGAPGAVPSRRSQMERSSTGNLKKNSETSFFQVKQVIWRFPKIGIPQNG